MPFDGGIDWGQTVRSFRAADCQFPVFFELSSEGQEPDVLARLQDVRARLEEF
jgi:hypothetical protein